MASGSENEKPGRNPMPINLIIPEKRAAFFCEGKARLDLAGSRFPDSHGYFLYDNETCAVALSIFSEHKNPGNTFWFPVVRECVQLGINIQDLEYWSALTFMATLYLDFQWEEIPEHSEEAKEVATHFLTPFRQQDPKRAFSTPSLIEFFRAFYEFAGLQRGSHSQPRETLAHCFNAVDFAHACAAGLNNSEREAFLSSVETKPYFEQLIIKSANAARVASKTGELMTAPLVRACTLKYKGFPNETNFFATYYQEAVDRGGLTITNQITDWIRDADTYSRTVAKLKPGIPMEMIEEHLEGMAATIDLFKEIEAAVPEYEPVAWCEYYWNHNLGYGAFHEINLLSLDKILILVDLIMWRNLMQSGLND
jgi:hypothetical protein